MASEPLKMLRGQSKAVWSESFQTAGWPAEAADLMAGWLTGKNQPPPDFAEVIRLAEAGAKVEAY